MFGGFLKKYRDAKAAQQGLTAAFRARGKKFMQMHSVVHEALVKEAIVTGVEATMQNFDRMEMLTPNTNVLIETYRERAKRF
jgi:hypothetical protein